jgi:hypothetical protein
MPQREVQQFEVTIELTKTVKAVNLMRAKQRGRNLARTTVDDAANSHFELGGVEVQSVEE